MALDVSLLAHSSTQWDAAKPCSVPIYYFSTNMAFMTFTVMGAFIMLLALSSIALILNIFIRRP